jgi:hypothetical protein
MTTEHPIERARRNLAYANSKTGTGDAQARIEMAAFLDFMHPNMPEDEKRKLINAAGAK